MRKLFAKIFLSVLLTVLFASAVSFLIGFWLMSRQPGFPAGERGRGGGRGPGTPGAAEAWRARIIDLLEQHARSLEDVLAQQGVAAAPEQMESLTATWGIRAYLIDRDGREVRGRDLPPAVRLLVHRAAESDEVQLGDAGKPVTLAVRLRTGDGPPYVFAAETPEMPPGPPAFAGLVLLRLAPLAIGLGLVCYFLARYVTSPVLRLRAALRRFGEGDLEQRVGASIGHRRDEIGELGREFDQMAERIATLLSAERRLLQDISHELRSPLARQRVALELARQGAGADTIKALDRAEREAKRLDGLIGELLMLARLESETDHEVRSSLDLADLVYEVVENAEFEIGGSTRSVRLAECAPCVATVVPEWLRRAVENVVRNALAYTADGTAVKVSLRQDATNAVILVRDRGPGVPEAELTDIFRPFYRVSRARERETGGAGLGLGLAIAARAVHSHGGSIVAANNADGGLTVEIRLPLRADN